jgi:glycosyltransferase involved in cell wall biosynthesis
VPPGDAEALAAALLRLADDRSELARLRTAARQLAVDRYSPGQLAAPLLARLSDGLPGALARTGSRGVG